MSAQLVDFLRQTLNPAEARRAEQSLTTAELQQGFVRLLLDVICGNQHELAVRQAGALFFKNYIKRNWNIEGDTDNISQDDRQFVKAGIVHAMTTLPLALQLQVGEAVTIIADTDFPEHWPGLIDDLVQNISITDMVNTNGVLQTAHSIFKRWRAQYRSDTLFKEIAYVLEKFCGPYLTLFKQVDELIEQNTANTEALSILFETMVLMTKVFYDLNSQDIPEFFEDNINDFMFVLHKYLSYSNASLEALADEDIPGPLERMKAGICEIAELYTQRYEEVFTMLPQFVNATWVLLTQMTTIPRYDVLVGTCLSFLTCVVRNQRHVALFQSNEILQQFVEKIVLPNIALRSSDEEMFEDDPVEYIRRDLEGGDSDTRRRSATEFVRALVAQFEQQMTSIVMGYANHYLAQYKQNPRAMWASKDTAMYLMSAIAIKGVVTKTGVSSTNLSIDIVQIYQDSVFPDLQAAMQSLHPILKLDAIKYILVFRNQLKIEQLTEAFPKLADHLSHENSVVSTYAAITIEALITLKRDNILVFNESNIRSYAELLLSNLLQLIEKGDTPESLAANDFLMRCVMRVILALPDSIAGLGSMVSKHLNNILVEVSKNPSNPQFNHYLFECYGAIFRHNAAHRNEGLNENEEITLGPLLALLQNDIVEFVPYVFQLLAQLIELRKQTSLPPIYTNLLQPILSPSLWDSKGNIPALVRLIQAFLQQQSSAAQLQSSIEPILGIFQKLIASKVNDSYGFELLTTIYSTMPQDAIMKYNQQIFILLLTRLNNSNTEKFTIRFVVFIFYLAALQSRFGPDLIISTMNAIQAGIFSQVYLNVILSNAQKIILPADTRTTSYGLTNFSTRSSSMTNELLDALWLPTITSQLRFLELPAQNTQDEDLSGAFDLDESGFQASFVRLRTVTRSSIDPWHELPGPLSFFTSQLNSAVNTNDTLMQKLRTLPDDAQATLKGYGVSI